jgi:hypothetical protein
MFTWRFCFELGPIFRVSDFLGVAAIWYLPAIRCPTLEMMMFCCTVNKCHWQLPQTTLISSSNWQTLRYSKYIPDSAALTPEIRFQALIALIIQHYLSVRTGRFLEYDENLKVPPFSCPQFNSIGNFVKSQWAFRFESVSCADIRMLLLRYYEGVHAAHVRRSITPGIM